MELPIECSLYATVLFNDETKLSEFKEALKFMTSYPVYEYKIERVTNFVTISQLSESLKIPFNNRV